MRPVTDEFLAALRRSHVVVTRVDVRRDGQALAIGMPVVGGTISLDRGAQSRGRCDVTFAVGPDIPTGPGSLLATYGNELHVFRGLELRPDGEQLIACGVFRIDTAQVDEQGLVKVTGMDRSARVRDARLEAPYTVPAGTNYGDAIAALVADGIGPIATSFQAVSATTPLVVLEEQADRWAKAVEWADAIGCELFFDGAGTLVLRGEPDLAAAEPVWTVDEGDGGVLLGASRTMSRQDAFNRVIAIGENPSAGAIYRGVATDADPQSPTFYDGPFGKVPRWYSSPLFSSDDQAQQAAEAMLARQLGVTQAVSFAAVPNPALEVGDVVHVRRQPIGVDELHIVETLTIPLAADGTMAGTTRARPVAA